MSEPVSSRPVESIRWVVRLRLWSEAEPPMIEWLSRIPFFGRVFKSVTPLAVLSLRRTGEDARG